MDRLLALIVRVVVWLSGFARPLSRLGLCRYEEYTPGSPLKILLVGYNGARNTGADARVVTLTQQLEELMEYGVVQKQVIDPVCKHTEYTLTDLGRTLIPIIEQLRNWGNNFRPRMVEILSRNEK